MQKTATKPGEVINVPHDEAAEKAVLGCIIAWYQQSVDQVLERGVSGEWFWVTEHRAIWDAITALLQENIAPDPVTIASKLQQLGKDELLGVFSRLPDTIPSAALLPNYLDLLETAWKKRLLLKMGTTVCQAIRDDGDSDVSDLAGEVERVLQIVRETRSSGSEQLVKEYVPELQDEMEHYRRGVIQSRGILTGIACLDKYLLGLGEGCGYYHVLAGRPSSGKTSLALQIAMNVALGSEPKPVLIVSMEMTGRSCVQRMVFSLARADLQRWRTGFGRVAVAEEHQRLMEAMRQLNECKHLWIDATGDTVSEEVFARIRRMHRAHGLALVVIDYMQLFVSSKRRMRPDRVQELSEISGDLRRMANRLKLPVIVLAQMNREIEKEGERVPRLSDLKDCGAIEQDADTVCFLYRPRIGERKEQEIEEATRKWEEMIERESGGRMWVPPTYMRIFVAKNRFGPSGNGELFFDKACTRFVDYQEWLEDCGLSGNGSKTSKRAAEEVELVIPNDDIPFE